VKLIVCATWVGCPQNHGDAHLAELVILEGTPQQLNKAMGSPLNLWRKRTFTCKHCGQVATVAPTGTYLSEWRD